MPPQNRVVRAAQNKYAASRAGRMGLTPSMSTSQTTPAVVAKPIQPTVTKTISMPAPSTAPASSSAQRDQMEQSIMKNNQVQRTYGVPGAK